MSSAFSSTMPGNPSSLAGVPTASSLLLNGIENDIRELIKLISSNRKLSVIRDSSERVLLRLSRDNLSSVVLNAPPYNINQQRYLQQKNIQQNQQDLSNNNNNKSARSDEDEGLSNELSSVIAEILIPYLLACNNRSASSKILIHSIGSIQRILGANSLGPAMRENEREGITKALSVIQSRCDEDPVLDYKVIQTIPLLLSSPHPITESIMKQCLEICFLYSVPRTITSSNKVVADTSAMAQQTFPSSLSSSSSLSNSLSGDNSSSLFSKAESLIKKNWSNFTTGSTPSTSEPIFDAEVSHAAIATLNQTISLLFSRVERDFSNYLANNIVNNKSTGTFSTIEFQTACSMLRELCKACDVVSAHGHIRARRFSSGAKASSSIDSTSSSSIDPLPPPSRTSSGSSSTTAISAQQNQADPPASLQQQSTAANSQNNNWFGQGMIELPLGLEIIETILSTNRNLFLHPELQASAGSIVKNNVCNLIIDVLDGRVRTVFTWSTVVRLMRIIIVLVCDMKPLVSSVSVTPTQQIGWGNTPSAASTASTSISTPFTTYVVESLLKTMETANTTSTVIVTPLWHRSLILETLHSLCMTPGFLRSIFDENATSVNESSVAISLFQKLVQVLTQFITKTMATNEAGAVSVDLAAKKTHSTPGSVQSRGLDMLTETEAPISITLASVILTATECLVSIADVLATSHADNSHVFQPSETSDTMQTQQHDLTGERKSTSFSSTPPIIVQIGPLRKPSRLLHVGRSSPSYSHEGEEEINQELSDIRLLESPNNNNNSNSNDDSETRARINVAMVNVAWKPMLGTFSLLLQTSNEESMIQFLLRAYMSLTTTCGVLGLNGPRDEFISSLCSFALPPQGISPFSLTNNQSHSIPSASLSANYLLSPKNLQILKALFNIAHGLGSILGTSWYIVLETFEQLDYIVFTNSQRRNLKHNITGIEGGVSSSSSSASLSSFSLLSSGNLFRSSEEMADEETSNAASTNIQTRFQIANMTDDDERVVVDLLRSLFESTRYLNDEAVKNVVIALSQLCFTTLAHMSTRSAPPSYILQNPNSSKLQTVLENSPRASEMSAFNETMSEPSVNMSFDDYENEDDDVDIELIEASMNSQQTQNQASDNIKKAFKAPTGWSKTTFPKLAQLRKKIGSSNDSTGSTNKSEADKNQGKQLDTSYNSSAYGGNKRRSLVQNVYSSTDDRDGLAHRLTYRSPPFALEKLVETTMKNLFRLNEVWDVTSQALISVASVGDPKIRMYAVESLETIVSAAIGMSNDKPGSTEATTTTSSILPQPISTPKKPSNSQDHSRTGRTSPSLFAGIAYSKVSNVNLICKITELAKSPHRDTKEAALSSLYRVISNCGLYLDDSWGIIVAELLIILNNAVTIAENENQEENNNNEADMSMLSESSVDDRSKIVNTSKKLGAKHQSTDTSYLIPSVFKVIQLIMDDYRPNLDAGSLPSLAHCLRSLGEQTIHVNISLTAVHMLWLLCEKCDDFIVISPETQKPIPSSQDRADELRLLIFDLLKWLSLDPRMEVRNSALRTLCSNIVSSSSRLSSKSWKSCACDIMIPLMKLIDEHSSRAASEPVLGEKLGRGTENRMVVHHSRDTAEKQWRETRVTILQGCAKFVRSVLQFMPETYADLPWFHEVWKCLLDDLSKALVPVYDESTSSMSFPPREIALAGISILQELALTVNGGGAKIKFAVPGMKVVGGTLVRIDEAQQSQTATDSIQHSPSINNNSPAVFAVPRKLWNDILSLYMQAYIPFNRHGDQPSSSTHDSDVPTQLTNSIAEMYESQNISPVMHEKETMETFMSTLTKLTRVFRSKARLISSLERAVLVCYQKMAPIPSDLWLSFFFNFKVFMLGSNGEGVDDAWVDFALKAAAIFLEMYESAPPEARAVLLINLLDSLPHYETLQKFHESKSEQVKNRTIIFDSLLVPFVKGGLALLSSKYPVDKVEAYWNRLLESIHFTSGERESVRLLNAIMDEARPMFMSGSLPESVEEHLLKVLVNLSSFSNITLIGTKRNTNLVKGENISICSVLQLLYLCKALNEILVTSSGNEKKDVENTKTRFSTAITLFSTAFCELMKSYLSLDENCSVSSVSTSPKSVTKLLDTDADTIVQVGTNQASALSSSTPVQERIPVSRDSKEFITATEDMVMIIDEIGNTPLRAIKLFDKESDDDNPFSYLRPVLSTILELIVVSSKDVRVALKSLLTKICVE